MSPRLQRILVSIALAPIALLLTEASVRQLKRHQIQAPRSDIVEADYMPTRLRGHYRGMLSGRPFATNAQGFREAEDVPLERPEGEVRVFVVGDSVGMGFGVDRQDTFTAGLQTELASHTGRIRVINASGQGYSPSTYLVYMLHEGLRFEPQVVVAEVELCNDLTDEALLRWGDATPDGLPTEIRGGRYLVSWDGNLLGTVSLGQFWFEKTYTYTMLLRRTLRLAYRIAPRPPFASGGVPYYYFPWERFVLGETRLEAGFQRLIDALEGLSASLEERGVRLVIAVFPSRFMFEDSGDYTRLATELYRRTVVELEGRNLRFLELAPTLQAAGGAERYLDFAHVDAAGHAAVAKTIGEAVAPLLP